MSTALTSLSGMNAAWSAMDSRAFDVANARTPGFRRQQAVPSTAADGGVRTTLKTDGTLDDGPEADVVGMLSAKDAFLANLAVFKAQDQATGSLLDVTA